MSLKQTGKIIAALIMTLIVASFLSEVIPPKAATIFSAIAYLGILWMIWFGKKIGA